MKPRIVIAGLALLLAGSACSNRDSADGAMNGPPPASVPNGGSSPAANLLLISLDTTRADHLSCYGYSRPTSPHIDALAADGHRFERAYTVMPTTLPAHAAMFTSLYPSQLSVLMNQHVVPSEATTLAERLKGAGFATGAFVSAEPLYKPYGLDQGFDHYVNPAKKQWRAEQVRKRAAEWLKAHRDRRFFCFVHMFDPHSPYDPPAEYRSRFNVPDKGQFAAKPGVDFEFLKDPGRLTPDVCTHARNAYDAEIAYADAQIGGLLADLTAAGLRDRTIIVFLSDHGETFDELLEPYGYAFDHGEFLYRRELRIPLVIWLPPGFANRGPAVHDVQISTLDLMPTLLALLNVPCDPPFEGRSFAPALGGGTLDRQLVFSQRHMIAGTPPPILEEDEFSVLDDRWHWIQSGRGGELFDLTSDPLELRNVAADHDEYPVMMRRKIAEWQASKGRLWREPRQLDDKQLRKALEQMGYLSGG